MKDIEREWNYCAILLILLKITIMTLGPTIVRVRLWNEAYLIICPENKQHEKNSFFEEMREYFINISVICFCSNLVAMSRPDRSLFPLSPLQLATPTPYLCPVRGKHHKSSIKDTPYACLYSFHIATTGSVLHSHKYQSLLHNKSLTMDCVPVSNGVKLYLKYCSWGKKHLMQLIRSLLEHLSH